MRKREQIKKELNGAALDSVTIAERYGVHMRTAQKILREIDGRPSPSRISVEMARDICTAEGTADQIAERFNVSCSTVFRARRMYGMGTQQGHYRAPRKDGAAVMRARLQPVFYQPFRDGTYSPDIEARS